MFERFTERARRVVVVAEQEARGLNHDYVCSEHVLLGLIHEDGGALALEPLGISLADARLQIVRLIGRGEQAPDGTLPLTDGAKKVLRQGRKITKNWIFPAHLLLGLAREAEADDMGVAAQVLLRLSGDLMRVRSHAIHLLARAPFRADDQPPPGTTGFERFTPQALRAVTMAQLEARGHGHDAVEPEDLLLGVVARPDFGARRALARLGIPADELCQRIEDLVVRGRPEPTTGDVPFAPGTMTVLALAQRELLHQNHTYVGTEHLLLGLIQDRGGVAGRALAGVGADLDRARNTIRAMVHTHGAEGADAQPVGGPRRAASDADVRAWALLQVRSLGGPAVGRDEPLPAEVRTAFTGLVLLAQGGVHLSCGLLRDLTRVTGGTPSGFRLAWLSAAANRITERTVTLLTIIGAAAAAADPVLALRMQHEAPELPALSAPQRTLLESLVARPPRDVCHHTASTVPGPGTVGVSRRGKLTSLLPTQLALPPRVLLHRYAERSALYRLHEAETDAPIEPVTLLLDTSPATFGPIEAVLRIVAHAITVTLWSAERAPMLVCLDRPDLTRQLHRPSDLAAVWAHRSLEPPALDGALARSGAGKPPCVLLTQHHLAADHGLVGAPHLRLVTAHLGQDDAPASVGGPYHAHLGPEPTAAQLAAAIRIALTPEGA